MFDAAFEFEQRGRHVRFACKLVEARAGDRAVREHAHALLRRRAVARDFDQESLVAERGEHVAVIGRCHEHEHVAIAMFARAAHQVQPSMGIVSISV
ncbi:hypothetical protein [Burkholderia sp. AW49-1]